MEGKKIPKGLNQPEDSSSSLLAVSFGPLKAFADDLGKKVYFSILFVKLGSPENGNEPEIIASNYSRHGRAYLINAKPGKYAAVALLTRVMQAGISIGFGSGGISGSSSMSDSSRAIFFPKKL